MLFAPVPWFMRCVGTMCAPPVMSRLFGLRQLVTLQKRWRLIELLLVTVLVLLAMFVLLFWRSMSSS